MGLPSQQSRSPIYFTRRRRRRRKRSWQGVNWRSGRAWRRVPDCASDVISHQPRQCLQGPVMWVQQRIHSQRGRAQTHRSCWAYLSGTCGDAETGVRPQHFSILRSFLWPCVCILARSTITQNKCWSPPLSHLKRFCWCLFSFLDLCSNVHSSFVIASKPSGEDDGHHHNIGHS